VEETEIGKKEKNSRRHLLRRMSLRRRILEPERKQKWTGLAIGLKEGERKQESVNKKRGTNRADEVSSIGRVARTGRNERSTNTVEVEIVELVRHSSLKSVVERVQPSSP